MQFPAHWQQVERSLPGTDGRPWLVKVWGWSSESAAAALAHAEQRLQQCAERILSGKGLAHYGYLDRPMREPVVESLADGSALITRNGQGVLVLNAARAAFVDIDLPRLSWWQRLWGGCSAQEAKALQRIHAAIADDPAFAARCYRTPGGLRLLITHQPLDPHAESTDALFAALGCDPLYRRLCQAQSCFRARLSPKPWRLGLAPPSERWPFTDPAEAEAHRRWCNAYHELSVGYAACTPLAPIGRDTVHPEIAPILAVHDTHACSTGAKLA